ncbi:glycosyltransferase [Leuconostoc gelidum]|uniref:glycosyltransferase n=1 Tax=Leuconostoc gelidum TaxID=1244 RepID=UPI001C7D852B|nr:glycosyltransferase [Leuconostoc gelidum]MBZ6010606.1 glycosyltransferase [Leuconostoc gelidum subsp. aenigmaticum]
MIKKVLIIGMTSNQGGIETFVLNVVSSLSKKHKFEFYVLDTTNSEIAYLSSLEKLGVHVIRKHYPVGKLAVLKRKKLAKEVFKEFSFDIIHIQANNLNTVFWVKEAINFSHGKIIFHSHNSTLGGVNGLKKYVLKLLMPIQKKILRKYDKQILKLAASDASGKWMFGEKQFLVIPNGVDTNKFDFSINERKTIREQEGVQNKKIIVLVARFSKQKNHVRLLQIFKNLLEDDNSYRLWLVGHGELYGSIHNMIMNDSALKENVRLWGLGLRKDIPRILSASDIVVMPSFYEGLPFSIVESQSNGLPCVVSKEAFDQSTNISGALKFVSLNDSNAIWASVINDVVDNESNDLKTYNENRHLRNNKLYKSNYSLNYGVNMVEDAYLK